MANDPILEVLKGSSALGVLQKLTNSLPYLSETEKRLVTYILEHPGEVVGMSVAELASKAGVGEATAFRVFRDLGLGGFTTLRVQLDEVLDRFGEALACLFVLAHSESDAGVLMAGRTPGCGPSRCVHHCARRRRPGGAGHLPCER